MKKTDRELLKELLKPLTYADGTSVPDEAFEKDLPPCEACEAANEICTEHSEGPRS